MKAAALHIVSPQGHLHDPFPTPAGGLDLACRLGTGAVLVLGWHEGRLPRNAEVLLGAETAGRGHFRAVAWPREDGAGVWYLGALRLPVTVPYAPGAEMAATAGAHALLLGALPADTTGPDGLATALRDRLPAVKGATVAQFLFDVVTPAALQRPGPARDVLLAVLSAISIPDGAIEVLGTVPGVVAIVQGWGAPAAEGTEVTLRRIDGTLERVAGREAAFSRSDIAAPASGVVHLLPAPADSAAPLAELLVTAADGTLLRRPVILTHVTLSSVETAQHLRGTLPKLHCDAESAALVRRALRPLYSGVNTLWSGVHPVRAAVDLVADLGSTGLHLQGWVFDPLHLARAVWLRGAQGYHERLDLGWTRIERPDVGTGIASDATLTPLCGLGTEHGFAVTLPPLPVPQALHLEFDFANTDCAFVPLPASLYGAPALRRLLEGVDLHKPSGELIVEQQIGPLVLTRLAAPPSLPAVEVVASARGVRAPAVSLLVPLPDPAAPVACFISQFMADPLLGDEEMVIALSGRWGAADVTKLRRRLEFGGLGATLLRTTEPTADAVTLLDVAACAARGALLLTLASTVLGRTANWRATLRAVLAAGKEPTAVIPTTVHEDFAVRSAGIALVRVKDTAPYVALHHHGAGLPASAARQRVGAEPRQVLGGGLGCCLLPALAVRDAGSFGGGHLLGEAQSVDFFARLRSRAGVNCVHVPAAEVYALEEPPALQGWERVAVLADGWALRVAQGGRKEI